MNEMTQGGLTALLSATGPCAPRFVVPVKSGGGSSVGRRTEEFAWNGMSLTGAKYGILGKKEGEKRLRR